MKDLNILFNEFKQNLDYYENELKQLISTKLNSCAKKEQLNESYEYESDDDDNEKKIVPKSREEFLMMDNFNSFINNINSLEKNYRGFASYFHKKFLNNKKCSLTDIINYDFDMIEKHVKLIEIKRSIEKELNIQNETAKKLLSDVLTYYFRALKLEKILNNVELYFSRQDIGKYKILFIIGDEYLKNIIYYQ